MFYGKIASGRSTLAAELARQHATILIAEDAWLSALFPTEMKSIADYVHCPWRLRAIMGPHVCTVLNAGVSVVLDFPANTVETRRWMRGILDTTNAAHQLQILTTPDETCLARLRERNARGDHPFAVSEEQFHQISKHVVAPLVSEGFNTFLHEQTASRV